MPTHVTAAELFFGVTPRCCQLQLASSALKLSDRRQGRASRSGSEASAAADMEPSLAEPTHIRELYPGVIFKGSQLPPDCHAHFRVVVQQRGADLEIELRKTFGGAPVLMTQSGDLPSEALQPGADIHAIRNDFHGEEDVSGVIRVVIPWREVRQGAYFISVYNVRDPRLISPTAARVQCAHCDVGRAQAWEPEDESGPWRRIDLQNKDMNYRLVVRFSARATHCFGPLITTLKPPALPLDRLAGV